jgi:class 3 adenylate cyclase/predicted ATPase
MPVSTAGELRQLTIMFCDLVGSTALAARLDPEDLREVIGTFHRAIADVVAASGGFVARYIGDGSLIYFGYPEAHEGDAECAVRASLQIVDAVGRLPALHGHQPQVRIGIATGLVIVGDIVGIGGTPEQDVAGETPNLAARLQAAAEPNTVVIAANTRRLAGGLFRYRDLDALALKGFSEPVSAYQVLEATDAEGRFEAQHESAPIPLVGRDGEIELLLGEWRKVCAGEGRAVLLSGEPGIGKSHLTVTLLERLPQPYARLRYFCSPDKQDSPFHPCIAQLERAAEFTRDDGAKEKQDKLHRALPPGEHHAENVALLGELLSLPEDERFPRPQLTPQKRKQRTMEALLEQLTLLSQRCPLVAIVEDAHWIDPSTHELLDLTVKYIANLPILLVVTFRPEFSAGRLRQPHAVVLALGQLPRAQAVAVVTEVAGKNALPDGIIEDIVERADGVPLFLEEMTRAVIEAGTHRDGAKGLVSRAGTPTSTVPTTLHAVLMARLDRIGPAKEVAQIGAAIGREFSYELLAAVAGRGDDELRAALARLIGAELAQCSGTPPHSTYLFKHALIRDAAYATLLRTTRKSLHRKIAEALETTFLDAAATQPEILAQHFTEAGLAEKGVDYWLKAGQRALMQSAMVEAVARLRRGLEVVSTMADGVTRRRYELDLQIGLGKALIATKGYTIPATVDAFGRARELCEELDQPPQLVSALYGQWVYSLMRAELAAAARRAEELLRLGEARNDPIWKLMGCRLSGVGSFPLGEFDASQQFLERGLQLYDPAHRAIYTALTVDDAHVVMEVYLSWVLLYLGHLDQGRKRRDDAFARARELNHAYTLAHALNGLAFTEMVVGSFPSALERVRQLMVLTEEHAISYYRAIGMVFHGHCLAALGQVEDGIGLLTRGLTAYRATGTILYVPTFLTWLADGHGRAKQRERGLALLDEVAELTESTQMRVDEAELHRVRGELLTALDKPDEAADSFAASLAVSRRQGAKLWELWAATSFARLRRDQGNPAAALEILQPVHASLSEGFDTPAMADASALLGALGGVASSGRDRRQGALR